MRGTIKMMAMVMGMAVLATMGSGCCSDKCCSAAAAEPNTLSAEEAAKGWQLLWDGVSSKGWRSVKSDAFPAKGWVIKDGTLEVLPRKEGGGGGDIITEEVFTDFILRIDFRLTPAANSGIKYFYDPKVNKGTTLEYQVLDAAHPDAEKGLDGNRKVASFYDVLPAIGAEPKPLGEWNTAMIISRGNKVEHWLNGRKVLAFERGSAAFRAAVAQSKFAKYPNWGEQPSGHILLQDHSDRVAYRNIKIKVLK